MIKGNTNQYTCKPAILKYPRLTDVEKLNLLKDAKGVSNADIGTACGVDKSMIGKILNDSYWPTEKLKGQLAAYFGVLYSWLWGV